MSKPRPTSKPPRIGRKRRTLGWTLLTLGLLVAGVWVASRWYLAIWVQLSGRRLGAGGGVVWVDRSGESGEGGLPTRSSWGIRQNPVPTLQFWSGWGTRIVKFYPEHYYGPFSYKSANGPPGAWVVWSFAFWPISLLLCTPAALLLRSGILARRRANTGACAKCGYSLAGLAADAPCPECGKAS